MRHKPGLFFITNSSSNKAVAAAILVDMQNNATPLSFVSFYFKLQFSTLQKKVSDTCMFTQNRTSESNMNFNCNSTYSALKLIEEMFY